ncbi:MAG: UDP-N-acetylmuramoyl-L-alanyl-D-glutamate--2,6-diaminopimelate ligase [Clostridia bacterium]|nr:UDP-N-acetylmuramoyl-L-alanyl-D-glutamate--2,6-diaminopimelate ligase [Clostridia bacterium]
MELKKLIKDVEIKNIIGNIENLKIENLCFDTKKATKNSLFFCLNGAVFDGHDFANIAIKNGAIAIVCERPLNLDVVQIVVESSRKAMSKISANFYKNPQNKLKIIGITGTNGKTSTTYMIANILKSAGKKVGIIGTIGIVVDGIKMPADLTTPDPIYLHKIFAQMVAKNVEYVCMEVSAHAIYLEKMFGIVCDIGVLTNITQDHLDFFKTFENYKKVKQKFISTKFCKTAIINVDDINAREMLYSKEFKKVFSYGLFNPCDVFAPKYNFSFSGTQFFLNLFDEVIFVDTKVLGLFNLYNMLCSSIVCKLLGIETKYIKMGLESMQSVPGRFNVLCLEENKTVIVDYAHTPDGIKNILSAVREITNNKIISLFGCGGNRDKTKRPIMGEISAQLSDYTIITSDNPRFEKPSDIIEEIESGVKKVTNNYLCIEDRKEAISCGLKMLNQGDVLVVLGKGVEDYLDINGVKYPYSDIDTITLEFEKQKKEKQII